VKHCHGAVEFLPGVYVQGDCGSADPHGEHNFDPATHICMGAPAGFEEDCGRPVPPDEHPYATRATR
jgi:hypothetical protein